MLFTILLVCANTMAQAVRERANEIAVLETLGFTEGRVLGLVLAESFALPVTGGLDRLRDVASCSAAGSDRWRGPDVAAVPG